jgi:NADH-quinone oxidoreductase subunit L
MDSSMIQILTVFLPLLSFILVGTLGQHLSKKAMNILSCGLLGLSALCGSLTYVEVVLQGKSQVINLFSWIAVGKLTANWSIVLNPLTATMVGMVTLISFLIHVYSVGYMEHDKTPARFMAYLGLFTFMMLILVVAQDLIQLFFGWEGVGLASYLLIGYWYERPSANNAAIKAFVVNRVGDLGLILGIGCIFYLFQTVNIDKLLTMAQFQPKPFFNFYDLSIPAYEVVALLLFFGAMGKSAQLGLHTWLPDAMEGPTPVSALIHAATMVTAGVFLLARLSPLYELAPFARSVVVVIGASTALFAGTVALTQNDIKRVIAYSTCSQLGYMFFAAGLSAYNAAIFHLVTHAFFKALLFLGAGAVIHAMSDEQNMQRMGGLAKYIPVTFSMMIIGSLALGGTPFFSGYFSKEAILEAALHTEGLIGNFAYTMGLVAAFLTALYSWRLIFLTFTGKSRADEKVQSHVHEPSLIMLTPLLFLSVGAVFVGFIANSAFLSKEYWMQSIVVNLTHEESSSIIQQLPILVSFLGIGVSFLLYVRLTRLPQLLAQKLSGLYTFLYNKWYFDELYNWIFVSPVKKIGLIFWRRGDEITIDGYGPDGAADMVGRIAHRLRYMQTGFVYHYAFGMVIGVVGILWWCLK